MSDGLIRTAGMLRQELSARNAAYATLKRLPHALSYGEMPIVSIHLRSVAKITGILFPPATAQYSNGRSGDAGCRKFTVRQITPCPKRIAFGANSILR